MFWVALETGELKPLIGVIPEKLIHDGSASKIVKRGMVPNMIRVRMMIEVLITV